MGSRAELFATVLDRLNRQDLNAFIDGWYRSASNQINRIMRVREMIKTVDLPFGDDMDLPADFLEFSEMKIVNSDGTLVKGALRYVTPGTLADEYRTGADPYRQEPGLFTNDAGKITIALFHNTGVFQARVKYFGKWPVLAADDDTNFLLDDAPHIYENAMLVFGHRHILEFDTASAMEAAVMQDIIVANEAYKQSLTAGVPLIMNTARKIGGRKS